LGDRFPAGLLTEYTHYPVPKWWGTLYAGYGERRCRGFFLQGHLAFRAEPSSPPALPPVLNTGANTVWTSSIRRKVKRATPQRLAPEGEVGESATHGATVWLEEAELERTRARGSLGSSTLVNRTREEIFRADRLSVSYCRSSGPGGQNVNKVNTKAEIRFHLASADWIAEDVRQKMAVMHKNKIGKSGELIVTSEVSRYQMRNLANCLQKIRDMIAEATETPKVLSREDVQAKRNRVEKMNRERLRQKKIHSSLKQSRRVDFD
ncbi:hypothetical protein lerEdw1_017768, partial [Lerista edwardsae]